MKLKNLAILLILLIVLTSCKTVPEPVDFPYQKGYEEPEYPSINWKSNDEYIYINEEEGKLLGEYIQNIRVWGRLERDLGYFYMNVGEILSGIKPTDHPSLVDK